MTKTVFISLCFQYSFSFLAIYCLRRKFSLCPYKTVQPLSVPWHCTGQLLFLFISQTQWKISTFSLLELVYYFVGGCGRARGRASVLLSEGRWFDSPGLHVEVSLGKILNHKLLLMCSLAPCMVAGTIRVWITVSHFGLKHLMNALNVND